MLEKKLGSDGQVYKAHDKHLDRTVAFKLLEPTSGGQPQTWDEARRLERLRSTFIVPVLNADIVLNSDLRYIVTPLVEGGDLESLARPDGLPVSLAVRYGHQIAAGIDTVHASGMVHRDIKPANALVNGDNVFVSDVEFCNILDGDGLAPRNGSWCTLAPEAAPDSGFCSIATDVYSIAATVFFLLSGEYPVDHRIPRAEQQILIAAGRIRNITDAAPHVPRSVAAVVRRGLSMAPAARHASAAAFGNALATSLGSRRDWHRVRHDGHEYCALSTATRRRGPLGVCSEHISRREVIVRAFHMPSGRAVSGVATRTVINSSLSTSLRSLFTDLSD
ncbi:serine/threonine-protein kinase [Arthrobacter sp. NPDC080082]|uniref:serine/threonine-protein kinase n=1 Tax=unclassified Arthrobacter TaxID=235627 RepID=UPI0034301B07